MSTQYTNHCVRVTSIVHLKAAGVEDRKICAVSGHRNVQSLDSYDRPTFDERKVLSKAVDKENVQPPSAKARLSKDSPPKDSPACVLSASGSTWSNVTVNTMNPCKRKQRLSLQLKKKLKKED